MSETIRILSLDGASSTAIQVRMLGFLEEQATAGFLDDVQMISGTSDGALVGLYIASRLEEGLPAKEIIAGAIEFSNKMTYALHATCFGTVKALLGFWPLISANCCEAVDRFTKCVDEAFDGRTVGDVKRTKFVAVSYDMTTRRPLWFQNFAGLVGRETAPDVRLADIALASSSMPLLVPLTGVQVHDRWRYFLDGSLTSNNPTAIGIASAVDYLQTRTKRFPRWTQMENLRVTSLGGRMSHAEAPAGDVVKLRQPTWLSLLDRLSAPPADGQSSLPWGWVQWLLNRDFNLLDLGIYGLFQNSVDSVAMESLRLLEPQQYHRYAPALDQLVMLMQLVFGDTEKLLQNLDDEATKLSTGPGFQELVGWVNRYWHEGSVFVAPSTTPDQPAA